MILSTLPSFKISVVITLPDYFFSLFNLLVAISKNSVLKLYNELLQIAMCKAIKNIVPETLHSPDICELCSTVGCGRGKR